MTPEGICSREPRCRFDDCYFVIKVNRNKNELVTKQLIYSSAWPRRGSLGKAGQWCSHSWEEQAAPQKCPQPEPDRAAFPGFHSLSLLLCASQIPPRPFCTVLPKQNPSVSGLKPNILSKMFQCCLCLYTAVGVGAGWSRALCWALDGAGIVCRALDGAGTLHWAPDRAGTPHWARLWRWNSQPQGCSPSGSRKKGQNTGKKVSLCCNG